jgi:hypothetical protein
MSSVGQFFVQPSVSRDPKTGAGHSPLCQVISLRYAQLIALDFINTLILSGIQFLFLPKYLNKSGPHYELGHSDCLRILDHLKY